MRCRANSAPWYPLCSSGRTLSEIRHATDPSQAFAAVLTARHLVPLNYVRGERWRRDIGLPAPPLLALAGELLRYPGSSVHVALTTLRRGMNRFLSEIAAPRAAIPA